MPDIGRDAEHPRSLPDAIAVLTVAANIPRRLGLRKPTRPKVDWSHPINRGLVSCWPIVPNAAGAPQIQDIAGQRHFTVSSGGISDAKFGGTTIKFNGSTQFASTPAAKDKFANLGALTISLWVMHLAAQSGRMLNYGGSTAVGGFTCTCNSTHDISFVHGFSTGLMARSTSNNTFTQNVWHHVVITWPGGLTAANVHTYIDTVEPTYRITTDGTGTQPDDSATQLFMGAASAVPGNPLNAAMENVRIFNRVLSTSEIKRLFQEPWVGIADRSEGVLYHVGVTGGGTNLTLTAAQGSFALTGQAAILNIGLVSSQGSFALNGQACAYAMGAGCAQGSFTLTGNPAPLGIGLVSGQGSFSLTGQDALFPQVMGCAQGTITLTGPNTPLNIGLTSAQGSFTETGQAAAFNITLTSAYGPFTLAGQDATLIDSGGTPPVLTGGIASILGVGRLLIRS